MRIFRFLFIILFSACFAHKAFACWDDWYSVDAYSMYRVIDTRSKLSESNNEFYPSSNSNCKEWQLLTSKNIPLDDIYSVVYEMSCEEFERFYENKDTGGNKFLEWMVKKDSSILDFMLLAKNNEYIRSKTNSRWYYPSMTTGASMTIEEVAEKALACDVAKLRDRYLLQAVRALVTMKKYDECLTLWNTEIVYLPENNLMRKLIEPYIAGAEWRIKRSEKATEYFAQMGYIGSLLYCLGQSDIGITPIDALELVCEHAPNSNFIARTLQNEIHQLEPTGSNCWIEKNEDSNHSKRLYDLCLKMAANKNCNNPAMWFYTAAFLADLKGDVVNASHLLSLAERSKSSKFIDESIKVFRMYIDAKTMPYNSSYENKLFTQLRWLDSKIINDIDENVIKETASGWKFLSGISFYYWNDMLRRIVISEICPRMIKEGKTTRALQLANMADNRLFNLVNKRKVYSWIKGEYILYTMNEYRYADIYNYFDYSNHFFEMIDSVGVNSAIQYVQTVSNPTSDFDKFLNARGYTGSDYLNDIVGTQCLRNMRYKEAVTYLKKVSNAYKNHLNVSMDLNPFCISRQHIQPKENFKYQFAQRMYTLEQKIEQAYDPNKKAKLLFEFAIGLRNSFDLCWELTQYYKGDIFWGTVCKKRFWEYDAITMAAINRSQQMAQLACDIATDKEVAANIHYALCNFKTVAEKYPDTTKGKLVIGKCDKLIDYYALSY